MREARRRLMRGSAVVALAAVGSLLLGCPVPDIFTFTPIGAKTVMEGETLQFQLNASDARGGAITFSMLNAPDGATLNGDVFTWTPQPGTSHGSPYSVKFVATNHFGRVQVQAVAITVTPAEVTSLNDAIRLANVVATAELGPNPLMTAIIGVSLDDSGMPDAAEPEDNPGWAFLFVDAEIEYGFGVSIHPDPATAPQVDVVQGDKYLLSSVYPPGQIPTEAVEQYTATHVQNWFVAALAEQAKLEELFDTDTHDRVVYVGLGDDGEDEAFFVFHNEFDIEDAWYQPQHMYALLTGGQIRVYVDPDTGDIKEVVILERPEDDTVEEALRIGNAFAKLSLGENPQLTGIIGVSISPDGTPDETEHVDNPGWALLYMNSTGTQGCGITIHPDPAHPGETIVMEGEPYALSSIYAPGTAPAQAVTAPTSADIQAWIATALTTQAGFAGLFTTPTLDTVLFLGASNTVGGPDQLVFSFHNEGDVIDHWYIPSHMLGLFGSDILTVHMDSVTGAVISTDPAAP